MKRLGNICGIFGEPAGVTGLAGIIKCAREGLIPRSATVATIVSGSGLKDVVSATRASGEACRIPADTHVLEKIITHLIQM
jgi:threonine synthase